LPLCAGYSAAHIDFFLLPIDQIFSNLTHPSLIHTWSRTLPFSSWSLALLIEDRQMCHFRVSSNSWIQTGLHWDDERSCHKWKVILNTFEYKAIKQGEVLTWFNEYFWGDAEFDLWQYPVLSNIYFVTIHTIVHKIMVLHKMISPLKSDTSCSDKYLSE
jgi:hypothetical protein